MESEGKVLFAACQVAEGDKADVDLAVAAAKRAFKFGSEWRTMDASNRGKLIHKFCDLIEQNKVKLTAVRVRRDSSSVLCSLKEKKRNKEIVVLLLQF